MRSASKHEVWVGGGMDEGARGSACDCSVAVHTGVELHRVAHGLCLGDALAPDISFTTAELMHHPQENFNGFYGYFTLKPNPNYDPSSRQPGTKYMRRQNVTREDILVYDVQARVPFSHTLYHAPAPTHLYNPHVACNMHTLRCRSSRRLHHLATTR